jgi:hypothetical protein
VQNGAKFKYVPSQGPDDPADSVAPFAYDNLFFPFAFLGTGVVLSFGGALLEKE